MSNLKNRIERIEQAHRWLCDFENMSDDEMCARIEKLFEGTTQEDWEHYRQYTPTEQERQALAEGNLEKVSNDALLWQIIQLIHSNAPEGETQNENAQRKPDHAD